MSTPEHLSKERFIKEIRQTVMLWDLLAPVLVLSYCRAAFFDFSYPDSSALNGELCVSVD